MRMLKIIIVECVLCILIVGFCSKAKADSIPGFLELDFSLKKYSNVVNQRRYYNTNISFKYGVSHDYVQPYLFGSQQTFFQTTSDFDRNHPFRDVYTVGLGIQIYKILYFEAGHTCSHFVESNAGQKDIYKSMTRFKDNHLKIGLKFNID